MIRKTTFFCLLQIALFLFLQDLHAGESYGGWRSCVIGGGGYVQNVVQAVDDGNILYCYIDVGGLYRSEDKGRSWRMLHGAMPTKVGAYQVRGLSVDPRDNKTFVFAVGNRWAKWPGGIFRTTDAGKTFKQVLEAPFAGNGSLRADGLVFTRNPENPDQILVASHSAGIFRSADNGVTWDMVGLEGCNITDIQYSMVKPNVVWVCASAGADIVGGQKRNLTGGFFQSIDGGKQWAKVCSNSPSEIVQCPAKQDILFGLLDQRPAVSTDRGKSWRPFDEGLPERKSNRHTSPGRFKAIAVGDNFLLAADASGDVYRTTEDFSGWARVVRKTVKTILHGKPWFKDSDHFGKSAGSIVIDRSNSSHWFLTDWYAVYQTFNAGTDWELTSDGIEDTVLHCFASDPKNPKRVYLGMADNGFFRSEDGGQTFSLIDYHKGITNNIKSIVVSPTDTSRLYATGPNQWHWEANQVFVSDDYGKTWKRARMNGLPDMKKHYCNTVIVDPKNKDRVYIGISGEVAPGKGGVYSSNDAGENWVWDSAGMEGNRDFFFNSIWHSGSEIARSANGAMVCISLKNWSVYRRENDDSKWQRVTFDSKNKPFCVLADNNTNGNFYLSRGEDGVLCSKDSGKNWKQILQQNAFHIALNTNKPGWILAGCDDGIWYSKNSGKDWSAISPQLPQRMNCYVHMAEQRAFAGTNGSGAFWIDLK